MLVLGPTAIFNILRRGGTIPDLGHGRFNYARPRNLVVAHAQLKMTGFCSSDVNRRLHTDTAESVGCLLGYDHTIG